MPHSMLPIWRFIGEPSIFWAGQELAPKLPKKAKALLAYLTLAPGGASRADLLSLLWPGKGPGNLRTCIHRLKDTFGIDAYDEIFEDTEERLSLNFSKIDADVRRLLDIEAGQQTSTDEIVDLCRGLFLQSLTTGSEPFDKWAMAQRECCKGVMARVLASALTSAQRDGRDNEITRLKTLIQDLALVAAASTDHQQPPIPFGMAARRSRRIWWPVVAAVLAGISAAVATWVLMEKFQNAPLPSIMVEPFTALNGTRDELGHAAGVTLSVTHGLWTIADILLVASPSGEPASTDPCEGAEKLDVRYLVTGSVAVDDTSVRVSVSTLDSVDCTLVWADTFDMPVLKPPNLQDRITASPTANSRPEVLKPPELQDRITLRILQEIGIEISSAQRNRIENVDDTENLQAWLNAAKGLNHLIKLTDDDLAKAKDYYRKALEFDPDYMSARRGLAWIAFLGVRLRCTEDQERRSAAIREAENLIRLVLRHRPEDGLAVSLNAMLHLHHRRWDEAEKSAHRSTTLLPGSADVWAVLAYILTYTGDNKGAIDAIEKAIELSPMHPGWYRWTKARALRLSGRHDDALALLESERDKSGPVIIHLVELAMGYSAADRIDEARTTVEEIHNLVPGLTALTYTRDCAPVRDPEVQKREFELLSKAGL